ncbi:MAG: acetylornithine deacetylase [Salinarimonadaceae bacterium]|nr:MAG: acetylornithine deacetylase [Salinarimonadaceae bacterium]
MTADGRDDREAAAVAMLERLVAFRTESRSSNLECVDFIRNHLAGLGIETTTIYDETHTKANIFATIGPRVPGGVVLSGHTDVVPAEEGDWTSDPFRLVERDGRLYGRGACDMKGFDAIVLSAVPRMLAAGLKAPVHIALSYDEEVGCKGAPSLVEAMTRAIPPPRAVIVGEPTMMAPVIGHKSSLSFFTTVKGKPVHSSRIDTGVSAVMIAARLIAWLDETMEANRRRAAPNGFAPPYTTLHCGMVKGGVAANIVAQACEFVTDIRSVPDEDPLAYRGAFEAYIAQEILPRMHSVAPETGVAIIERSHVPSLAPEPGGAAGALARELTGVDEAGFVSYGTEAGIFQRAGWSTVVCGPGDIAQAHQADEYLSREQLRAGVAFTDRLIARLSD